MMSCGGDTKILGFNIHQMTVMMMSYTYGQLVLIPPCYPLPTERLNNAKATLWRTLFA